MSDEQKKDVLLEPTSEGSNQDKVKDTEPGKAQSEGAGTSTGETVQVASKEEQVKPAEGQASPEAPEHKVVKVEPAAKTPAIGEATASTNAPAKEVSAAQAETGSEAVDAEKEAKAKAAAEARAARASARAKKPEAEEDTGPKEPSPNQPRLDGLVQILKQGLGEDAVEEAFINERDAHLPYVILKNSKWLEAATVLRDHEELKLNYLRNVSGVDQETHMEVIYHLLSLESKHEYCVKVKTNRDTPSIASVTQVWPTANWNEREIYDLLGIDFPGHPDLRRIMMSDDWVGHPLRKDYEPLDPEV